MVFAVIPFHADPRYRCGQGVQRKLTLTFSGLKVRRGRKDSPD